MKISTINSLFLLPFIILTTKPTIAATTNDPYAHNVKAILYFDNTILAKLAATVPTKDQSTIEEARLTIQQGEELSTATLHTILKYLPDLHGKKFNNPTSLIIYLKEKLNIAPTIINTKNTTLSHKIIPQNQHYKNTFKKEYILPLIIEYDDETLQQGLNILIKEKKKAHLAWVYVPLKELLEKNYPAIPTQLLETFMHHVHLFLIEKEAFKSEQVKLVKKGIDPSNKEEIQTIKTKIKKHYKIILKLFKKIGIPKKYKYLLTHKNHLKYDNHTHTVKIAVRSTTKESIEVYDDTLTIKKMIYEEDQEYYLDLDEEDKIAIEIDKKLIIKDVEKKKNTQYVLIKYLQVIEQEHGQPIYHVYYRLKHKEKNRMEYYHYNADGIARINKDAFYANRNNDNIQLVQYKKNKVLDFVYAYPLIETQQSKSIKHTLLGGMIVIGLWGLVQKIHHLEIDKKRDDIKDFFRSYTKKDVIGTNGLPNFSGVACYQNAALQLLFNAMGSSLFDNTKNRELKKAGLKLFQEWTKGKLGQKGVTISTRKEFTEKLPKEQWYKPNQQFDTTEFFQLLVSQLNLDSKNSMRLETNYVFLNFIDEIVKLDNDKINNIANKFKNIESFNKLSIKNDHSIYMYTSLPENNNEFTMKNIMEKYKEKGRLIRRYNVKSIFTELLGIDENEVKENYNKMKYLGFTYELEKKIKQYYEAKKNNTDDTSEFFNIDWGNFDIKETSTNIQQNKGNLQQVLSGNNSNLYAILTNMVALYAKKEKYESEFKDKDKDKIVNDVLVFLNKNNFNIKNKHELKTYFTREEKYFCYFIDPKTSVEDLRMGIELEKSDTLKITENTDKFFIALKRFKVNPQLVAEKIESKVQAFDTIDIYVENGKKQRYKCKGFAVHSGYLYGGHYVAYFNVSGQWKCFNDSSVTNVSEERIKEIGEDAYMYYYEKIPPKQTHDDISLITGNKNLKKPKKNKGRAKSFSL